jgi:glycosyltransferase involved in cell wall biosynthesis
VERPADAVADGRKSPRGASQVLLVVEQLRRRVPGGVGTYARGLIKGLSTLEGPSGVEVVLHASRFGRRLGGTVSGRRSDAPRSGDPLEEFGITTELSRLPSRVLTRAWDHGWVSAPKGFPVVHSVSTAFPGVVGSSLDGGGRGAGGAQALVVCVHDVAWRRYPESTTKRGRSWHESALRRAIASAQVLVVPSAATARDVIDAGAREDRISVMTEGADHLPPPDVDAARSLLERRGVKGDYLLSVGTLEPRKNVAGLVQAYRAASSALGGEVPLVVVGPRGWGGREPGAVDVVYLGPVSLSILAGLYRLARTFVYVPLVEGYGLPPLEAMRSRVPVVVSSEVPSVSYRAGDFSRGDEAEPRRRFALSVDARDVDEIADAIVVASTDDSVRAELIEAGSELASSRTWRRCALEHVDIWKTLG